ncbi:MAG: AmmeMemoRadiSam system protein A [Thermodesulfobacteriota bacterium]
MSELSDQQGAILVRLARETLISLLGETHEDTFDQKVLTDPIFQEKRGIFVTLKKGGQLRGCIGSLTACQTLTEGIRNQAENAAFYDTRFNRVQRHELADINLEISILSEPQPLFFSDPEDLICKLRPHVDGVILTCATCHSTFLPQVWEQLPDVEDFLAHLSMKAGLPREGWKNDGVEIATYQVQHFDEQTS